MVAKKKSAKKAPAKKKAAPKKKAPAKKKAVAKAKARKPTKVRKPTKAPKPTKARKPTKAPKPTKPSTGSFADVLAEVRKDVDADTLALLRAALKRHRGPINALANPQDDGDAGMFSWSRQLMDPAILEVILEEGGELELPKGEPESFAFWLKQWAERDLPEDALTRVIAHPFLRRVLVQAFLPTRETRDEAGTWLERGARLDSFAPILEEVGAKVVDLCARWTVGALEVHGDWLERLCRPAVLRRAPAIATAVRGLEMSKLLAAQLRAGIMDEWGWPAQDEILARIGDEGEFMFSAGPAPYMLYRHEESKRIVACGPDGVVFDEVFPTDFTDVRGLLYVDGDVLVSSYPKRAKWVKGGQEFDGNAFGFFDIAMPDGAPITRALRTFERGSVDMGASTRATEVWFDGTTFYALADLEHVRADGTALDDPKGKLVAFDPTTGTTRPTALPAWFQSLLGPDGVLITNGAATHMMRVPSTGAASPLGAKGDLGAAALYMRDHDPWIEGIDGRRAIGRVNGQLVSALITFPEREGFYPIVQSNHDLGIALPDGTTPLVPIDKLTTASYWTRPLKMSHWYALRPRDPAGSRALARCTDEKAKALLAASVAPAVEPDEVKNYGNMQAVLISAPEAAEVGDAQRAAIARVLPEITHPQLVEGVAQIAAHAAGMEDVLARMRSRLASALAPSVVESTFTNRNAASLAVLLGYGMNWWDEKLGTQLGQQMLDVSRYLFTDTAVDPRTPAATIFPWTELMPRIGEVLYRALACATPKQRREEFVAILDQWRGCAFCDHLPQLRYATLSLPATDAALAGMTHETPDRLAAWGTNRYFLRWRGRQGGRMTVLALEATRDGVFRVPPGGELLEQHVIDTRFDRRAIESALALARDRVRVEYAPDFADIIARATGLSRPAAALAWGAGYDPWLLGDKALERMQLQREDLDLAELELKGKRLSDVYSPAMPADPADMFQPAGAHAFADAWNARFGALSPLPVELVSALRADLRDDALPLATDTRMLVAPDAAPYLTRDEVWVMRPVEALDPDKRRYEGYVPAGWPLVASMKAGERNPERDTWFHGFGVGRFARYAAWAYQFLPAGDATRASILRAAELVRARLANPELLVLAGIIDLSAIEGASVGAVVEPLRGAAYRAAEGASAPGFDRGDIVTTWPDGENGAFIAVRPARIPAERVAAVARDLGILRFGVQRTMVRLGGHTANRPTTFAEYLAFAAPAFQRMLDDANATPAGKCAGDPRVTGASAIAAVRAKHRVSELGAALYLLRAVGVTDVRAARILGTDVAAAVKEIGKLPVIEPTKVHGLESGEEPLFGRLMPLRPMAELWAAAVG